MAGPQLTRTHNVQKPSKRSNADLGHSSEGPYHGTHSLSIKSKICTLISSYSFQKRRWYNHIHWETWIPKFIVSSTNSIVCTFNSKTLIMNHVNQIQLKAPATLLLCSSQGSWKQCESIVSNLAGEADGLSFPLYPQELSPLLRSIQERTGDQHQLTTTLGGLQSSALAPEEQVNYPTLSKICYNTYSQHDLFFRQKLKI